MTARQALHCALIAAVALLIGGCQYGYPHVTGRVTFPDGTPLTYGHVVFTDDYTLGKCDLDENGEYSLHMFRRNDGIRPGTYKVYISGAVRFKKSDVEKYSDGTGGLLEIERLIDEQYANPDASGWVVEVKKNMKVDLVVYPQGEVPEDQRTELAKYMFDPEYRKKVNRARNKPDLNDFSTSSRPKKKRLVNPSLL